MNKLFSMIFIAGSLLVMGINANQAQAASVTFGSEGKMYAPNCHCKADVGPYNLAPWCGVKNTCNGESNTQTINVSAGDYKVKVNLGGLTDSQKYEVVILTMNGQNYTIPDQGGNSSSTGTAVYNLGTLHLSGNISFKAKHKYATTFTGKWYSSEASKIGSGNALESVDVNSIVLDKIEAPTPPVVPAPTCKISASPTTINKGASSTLSWSSTNATSASINQGIGGVAVNGSKNVSPVSSTTYTMTVSGNGKTATCQATVSVVIPPVIPAPTCAISANPSTINSGEQSVLTWTSTNATSLSIDQNIGSVALNGSKSVAPVQNTTYTATAVGAGGRVTCDTTIKVNVLKPAISIIKDDNDNSDDNQTVTKNGTATFKITIRNTGNAPLKDVIIYDELAPNCQRSAAQTKGLYAGDLFDPGESFSYVCTDNNITESYTNKAVVKATDPNKPGTTDSLSDEDTSKVIVPETPAPTPEPEPTPTPEPTPEPKKERCDGTIGNYVWLDANSDGVQDKGEKGLSGISVKLKKDNGKLVDKETTNKNGEYEFDDLCEGDYTVYIDDEDVASYTQTFDPDGKKNNQTDVELEGSHDSHTKADFGYNKGRVTPATGPGSIALYLTGLISLIILLSYKQLKEKLTPSLQEQFKRLAK